MNLARMLKARADVGRPVRVGLIGAGKFGSMFLSQVRTTPGLHLLGIADLSAPRARAALERTGWDTDAAVATSFDQALRTGRTMLTEDAEALISADGLDVVIEATGSPAAGAAHALKAIAHDRHIVMVTVEADVLVGPLLATHARQAGVVYSMAYGDQPALVCEMVDWARCCGFHVVAAGKGTKYLPAYHASTPDTVWQHYGLTPEQAAEGGMNAQMFNSFLDGTKSAIEMAAIANAAGLAAPSDGLLFPPCGVDDLATILRPRSAGGVLEQSGTVETVSSIERDGRPVYRDLRWGVYVVFEAEPGSQGDYARRCFKEYGVVTDSSGRYTALYRPNHLIGLELGVSVASAALRGEPTGTTDAFNGDVVAVAKRALKSGEVLDGEGGHTVWGKVLPAAASLARGALPIGLAHRVTLKRDIAAGNVVGWADVSIEDTAIVRLRREMERAFAGTAVAAQ
ncbi:NAD(P)H-dependent oxidoreductase [Ancylobacter pratisalsi]|uniref:Gfo/Idh/MocA family oxidoreductase n=1 Tax=Ancylobacter pratisalsi TaxID=1745854 RepID=A0A6P1YIE1_9HYPH|nr:Gfo/Idh/MocA family oxidoreductase [Ancylobacter pratisalsi]QIB33049.1 Gfo/Idh/MocA family oxidoreductase [Ancylobacter pratisalsi]